MTIEEAIQDIRENIKPVVGGKSLDVAIDALEKQIPKEPTTGYDGYADEYPVVEYYCPTCDGELDYDLAPYCPYCGQKLDWDGEE